MRDQRSDIRPNGNTTSAVLSLDTIQARFLEWAGSLAGKEELPGVAADPKRAGMLAIVAALLTPS